MQFTVTLSGKFSCFLVKELCQALLLLIPKLKLFLLKQIHLEIHEILGIKKGQETQLTLITKKFANILFWS